MNMPYKTEDWHVLSHEQYFKKHCSLDINDCDFNFLIEIFSLFLYHCGFLYSKYLFKLQSL